MPVADTRTSAWNVARGVAGAVPLALTPIVASTRIEEFDGWILQFSLLPWFVAAQLGLQSGVVATAAAHVGDRGALARLARQAVRMTLAAVVVGGMSVWLGIRLLDRLGVLGELASAVQSRPDVYVSIVATAAAFGCAGSLASLLLAVGHASAGAVATVCGALVTIGGLAVMEIAGAKTALAPGLCTAAGGLVAAFLCFRAVEQRVACSAQPSRRSGDAAVLVAHMRGQLLWVLPGLLISGLDTALVAEFEPEVLGPYSLALVITTLGAGFVSALAAPMIAVVASAHERGQLSLPGSAASIRRLWLRMTSAAAALPAFAIIGATALFAFQGREVTGSTRVAIVVVCCGHGIRLLTAPLASASIGLRRQIALSPSPLAEAAVNVLLSVALGAWLGAPGVALGTLAGAVVAVSVQSGLRRRAVGEDVCSQRMWRKTVVVPTGALLVLALSFSMAVVA